MSVYRPLKFDKNFGIGTGMRNRLFILNIPKLLQSWKEWPHSLLSASYPDSKTRSLLKYSNFNSVLSCFEISKCYKVSLQFVKCHLKAPTPFIAEQNPQIYENKYLIKKYMSMKTVIFYMPFFLSYLLAV